MPSEGDQFLDVAADLGRRIADSAIWYGGRANWMGMLPGDESLPSENLGVHRALGPDLYSGTSGIALFLAEAAARLGDRRLRATGSSAIRHALDHADQIEPESCDGLYAGSIGIAYAAARVGRLLDAEVALGGACALLAAWRRDRVATPASDMVSGYAGAVAGLVTLAELLRRFVADRGGGATRGGPDREGGSLARGLVLVRTATAVHAQSLRLRARRRGDRARSVGAWRPDWQCPVSRGGRGCVRLRAVVVPAPDGDVAGPAGGWAAGRAGRSPAFGGLVVSWRPGDCALASASHAADRT